MYIVSHRCGSLENEEHTITAINHSLTLNIYSIEVDIQFTENNEIVLSHDPVRTNKKYTKLEDLLNLIILTDKILFLEIKGNPTFNQIKLVKKTILPYNNIIILSFNYNIIEEFNEYPCMFLLGNIFNENILDLIFEKNIKYIGIDYQLVSKEYITLLQKYKCKIFAYTINNIDDFNKIKFLVDGIITDLPSVFTNLNHTHNN